MSEPSPAYSTSSNDRSRPVNSVQNTLTLVPATVTKVSETYDGRPFYPTRRPKTEPQPDTLVTMQVDPQVWETAKRLAGGDARRLEVISATNVKIHNERVR